MESVLQQLADLKKDRIYKAVKLSPRLYTVKEQRSADLDGFGDEDEWDQVGSWNYVSIIEKFDEDKEENGTIPTLIFGPSSKSLLGFIDLNRLEIIDRNTGVTRLTESTFMDEDKTKIALEEEYSSLPIVPCVHPIGLFHMTVVLHPDQNLPQLIGPDVVEDMFLIAAIFLPASGAVVGFNSLNAGAASNRLHVELLLSPSFSTPASSIPEEQGWPSALPILQSKGETIFMGRLLGEEDYSDYSVLVELTRHQDPEVRYFKLEFKEPQIPEDGDETDLPTIYSSIVSFAIAELVGLRLPHNIVWLNSGKTLLIFPRKPDSKHAKWGWPEMVGLNRFSDHPDKGNPSADEKQFTEITEAFKAYLVQKLFANSNEPN